MSFDRILHKVGTKTCTVSEAKSKLGELADAAIKGKPTVIIRGGKVSEGISVIALSERAKGYFDSMIVTATEMANHSKSVLDRVIQGGEVVEIQRHGRTVAEIRPRIGASRSELLQLLRRRGFSPADSRQLQQAMDAASTVFGYAGRD